MSTTTKEKYIPTVGEQCYIRQFTRSYYVDLVKTPYTVIAVSKNEIVLQAAKLIYPIFKYDPDTMTDYYKQFDGRRVCFFDTVAESIEPDPTGKILHFSWHGRKGLWGTAGMSDRDYPSYAIFGQGYQHMPYLD